MLLYNHHMLVSIAVKMFCQIDLQKLANCIQISMKYRVPSSRCSLQMISCEHVNRIFTYKHIAAGSGFPSLISNLGEDLIYSCFAQLNSFEMIVFYGL